jgi:uncharacterized phage-associated protein
MLLTPGVQMIRFDVDNEKLVSAMAYIAERVPGLSKMVLSKLLYFADKEHLLEYGRPITGDHYARLEHGPVPSVGLNMMRGMGSTKQRAAYNAKLRTTPDHVIHVEASADTQLFSRSDLRVLDHVIAEFGQLNAKQLRDLSHKDAAFTKVTENSSIPYEVMFEDGDAGKLTLELLKEEFAELEHA